jgi:hypothetical protein
MNTQDVEITQVDIDTEKELSSSFYHSCFFCDKLVSVRPQNFKSCVRLSGKKFHCAFCLRNNHNYRSNRNVLILSYRGIIGYYYRMLYLTKPHKLWFNQIENLIEKHQKIGLQNPVFSYDPSTFLWFIDFNKIGSEKRKAPFDDVQKNVKLMFDVFDIETHIEKNVAEAMLDRFDKALTFFYEKRKRPKDRRMLIPTFSGLVGSEKSEQETVSLESRNFVKNQFILK